MADGTEKKLTTGELMRRLFSTASIGRFLERNEQELHTPGFAELTKRYAAARAVEPREAIRRAHIERVYGYQLFSGTRQPSRDKALQIAIALGLSVDETQTLLRAAGRSELYARLKRDAALLYCLNKKLDMDETQALLEELSLPALGGMRGGDDEPCD